MWNTLCLEKRRLFWPCLTVFDHFWPFVNVLTVFDHYCLFLSILTAVDCCWSLFTIFTVFDCFDHFRSFLTGFNRFWQFLTDFDHTDTFWPFCTVFDSFWLFWTVFDRIHRFSSSFFFCNDTVDCFIFFLCFWPFLTVKEGKVLPVCRIFYCIQPTNLPANTQQQYMFIIKITVGL